MNVEVESEGDKEMDGETEEEMEETCYVGFTGRTASGMLKDMFNPYSPFSSPGRMIILPGSASPSISASSLSNESVVMSPEKTSNSSESGRPNSPFSKEVGEYQEMISAGETVTSDEERGEEGEGDDRMEDQGSENSSTPSSQNDSGFKGSMVSTSSISSVSTSTSDDNDVATLCRSEETGQLGMRNGLFSHSTLTINGSPARKAKKKTLFGKSQSKEEVSASDLFLQNFNPKVHNKKISDPGFYTIRRPNSAKVKKGKGSKRFSMKPPKVRSVDAEISSPAPVTISAAESPNAGEKPLIRQTAIRGKKGTRISQGLSQVIPEASYALEITTVNAIFKSNKMEIPCRGRGSFQTVHISTYYSTFQSDQLPDS